MTEPFSDLHLNGMTRFLMIVMLICACSEPKKGNDSTADQLSYQIFESEYGGFGYEIMLNNKRIIYQPNIPTETGYLGFTNKADASAAAQLVLKKIRNGEIPPSITKMEIDSLLAK